MIQAKGGSLSWLRGGPTKVYTCWCQMGEARVLERKSSILNKTPRASRQESAEAYEGSS